MPSIQAVPATAFRPVLVVGALPSFLAADKASSSERSARRANSRSSQATSSSPIMLSSWPSSHKAFCVLFMFPFQNYLLSPLPTILASDYYSLHVRIFKVHGRVPTSCSGQAPTLGQASQPIREMQSQGTMEGNGAPGRTRTRNPWVRSPVLYPLSYRRKRGETTKAIVGWGERRDSNP